jgi:hypothetical protein
MRVALFLPVVVSLSVGAFAAPAKKAPSRHTAAVSTAVHKIPESGPLDSTDLMAIARLRSNYAEDQFSDDPTLAFVGRSFVITVGQDELTTDYDKEAHALKVSTPTYSDGFKLAEEISVSHYVGRNGYGARAVVTERRGKSFGVWIPGESFNRKPITYSTNLDAAAARDLSQTVRLRLSGVITRANGVYADKDSAIYEKLMYADATVNDPYSLFIKQYYVSVAFTKAEWIDGRSGQVLATQELTPQ